LGRDTKNSSKVRLLPAAVSLLLCTGVAADEFRFEVSAGFDGERLSTTSPLFGFDGQEGTVFADTGTDTTALTAAWYFSGASDNDGPWSRAVFLSRASSLNLAYRRTDVSADISFDPPLQLSPFPGPIAPIVPPEPIFVATPVIAPRSFDGDEFSLGGRYVWAESGWFVFGNVSIGDADTPGNAFGLSIDTQQLIAGGGVYLGERTAIEVAVIDTEIKFTIDTGSGVEDSSTGLAISLTHIGNMGSTWQYGIDAALIDRDSANSDTAVALRGSLFPTPAVAFGLEIETEVEGVFDTGTRYSAFGSWFVTRQLEFFGKYGMVDIDAPAGSTADLDVYSLGFLGRF
jgi:hypothetical protein